MNFIHRDSEIPIQTMSSSFPPHAGMQPSIQQNYQNFIPSNISMQNVPDQFGSPRPAWYDPQSNRY